ncbi:hypothetical protein O181_017581 [Austropuccinia psidii MF-1]|uniref:Kinesin motor domain-containing protein n=1 Tax=Austropuccinia psidii MF-1 TaxID=1389203 RepID=A0A9Q3GS40_9BASI|nr:hypothetical protein [Austropuccinia psidii MF-1]
MIRKPSNKASNNQSNPSTTTSTSSSTRSSSMLNRTRTLSTHSIKPSSTTNKFQANNKNSSINPSSIPSKISSNQFESKNINNHNSSNQSDLQELKSQSQSNQSSLPGANIKVVVRCRALTQAERDLDPQVVLFTGGIRGHELTVDVNNNDPSNSNLHNNQPNSNNSIENNNNQQKDNLQARITHTDYSSSLVDDPKRNPNIKVYPFDHVFGPEADQALIFTDVVAPILTEVLQGYNCTIFAYGQTGTGKTYTMTGDLTIPTATTIMPTTKSTSELSYPTQDPNSIPSPCHDSTPLVIPTSLRKFTNQAGIIPRVLHTLFNMLEDCSEEEKVEFGVKVSFVELYNEELRDLNYVESCSTSSDYNPPIGSTNLKIFEDSNQKKGSNGGSGVYIQNLTETSISSAQEGIKILTLGSSRRQIAATKCNEQSSRSHSVFSITIHVKENNKDGKEDHFKIGKLNLVDLAGSENVGRSGAGKEFGRAREAGMINQSLLTLGRVINALVEKNSHVPYRESKLTRLLQDSLGGKTKTCIIATVSPSRWNLEETLSTLDYALRAKSIKNRPELNNKINKSVLINQYINEIEKLRHDLIATRTKNGIYFNEERWAELMKESENKNRNLIESKRRIELIELELIGVKKEFEKCLRILNLREGEIKKVQDEFSKKSLDFEEMKSAKEALEADLSKERKKRESLEKSRIKWKSQCMEAFEDNEGLRAKIDRKAAVESFNHNTLTEVRQSLASSTVNLKNDLKEFGMESNQLCKSAKSCTTSFEQSLVKSMKDTQDAVDNRIPTDFHEAIGNLSDLIQQAQSQAETFATNIQSNLIPNHLVKEAQNYLSSIQAREGNYWSTIQAKLSQIKIESLGFVERTKVSLQSSLEIMQGKFKEDRDKLIKSHQLEKSELKEEAARLKEDIELLKQHASDDERRMQQDERELIELIQQHRAFNLKRKLAQTDLLTKSLNELKERKERKKVKFSELEKEFDVNQVELDNQLDRTIGSACESLERFEASFQEGQARLLEKLEANRVERDGLCVSYSNRMERLGFNLDQTCSEFMRNLQEVGEDLKVDVEKVEKQIEGHHQKVSSQIGNQIQLVNGSVRSLLSDIEGQSHLTDSHVDKSMSMITNLRNDVHTYLTQDIRQDINTGQTPRRKELIVEATDLPGRNNNHYHKEPKSDTEVSLDGGLTEFEKSTQRASSLEPFQKKIEENEQYDEDDHQEVYNEGEETIRQIKTLKRKRSKKNGTDSLNHTDESKLPLIRSKSRSNGILRDKANRSINHTISSSEN